ncbi:MAG: hypothetical protein AAFU85_20530 [Planctomycetota bacterium]
MLANVLTLALLVALADDPDQRERTTAPAEGFTTLTVNDMIFTARTVRFRAENGSRTCVLEGKAKVRFGDISITADSIQCNGKGELEVLSCVGNCTWRQDDGSGEVFRADQLEVQQDGLRLSGNASLRYGSSEHATVVTCDSIVLRHGNDGYEFVGNVRLRRSK